MTTAPYKPCRKPGCPDLTRDKDGYCNRHKGYGIERISRQKQALDKARGTSRQRGYSTQWDKVRAVKVMSDPICEMCREQGRTTATALVHHIIPVSARPDLLLVMDNLQSLCVRCHALIHGGKRWDGE